MKYLLSSCFFDQRFRFRNVFLLIFGFSLSIVGCKKGDTGPAGPTGPQGAKGDIGTPNVSYSDWFTPAAYTKDTIFNLYHFYYNNAAASITQKIVDSGSVLVYGKLDGYNSTIWPTAQVSLLPVLVQYKFSTGGITYTDTWSAFVTAGNLQIDFADDQNYYGSIANTHQFRYIIIPGGVKVTSASKVEKQGATETDAVGAASATVRDWKAMSYEQVCEALNIAE